MKEQADWNEKADVDAKEGCPSRIEWKPERTRATKTSAVTAAALSTLLSLALAGAAPHHARADGGLGADEVATRPNPTTRDDASFTVGIEGRYRLGRWTSVLLSPRVDLPDDVDLVLETTDGDGVPVAYRQADLATSRRGFVIPGSEAAPLVLRSGESASTDASTAKKTSTDVVLARGRFPDRGSPAREASLVPQDMPWIVIIGDPLGIDTIGANSILGRDAQVAISHVRQAEALPTSSLGYSGVDLMVINATGMNVLRELDAGQGEAITHWIQSQGGELFVTLGGRGGDLLAAAPWLIDVLPFESVDVSPVTLTPAALETFTSSQTPLQPFDAIRLPDGQGTPLITGRTNRRVTTRFAARYVRGFGQVTVLTADLDDDMFAQWPQRLDLIKRLVPSVLPAESTSQPSKRITGFDDLAGQTRATLDQFSMKRPFAFSLLSLTILGLILLIGPLDYLLINRLLGRPLLGWLTLPLIAAGFSVALALQSRQAVPSPQASDAAAGVSDSSSGLAWNRLEITDIDSATGTGRGLSWNVVYSHRGGRFDTAVTESSDMLADHAVLRRSLTRPFGFAGPQFGGIQIQADTGLPEYDVVIRNEPVETDGAPPLRRRSTLAGLPIAPRSSKSFAATYTFDAKLDPTLTVRRRGGSDLLQGDFRNPLPMDLLDGMLVFRNWAYRMPTRLPAGARIPSLEELRQENFRWYLTRQKTLESNSDALPWNPGDFGNLLRITEMLMFHDVVGGARYTGLTDGPLGHLDLTELLVEDRCVLIGRLAEPLTTVTFQRQSVRGNAENSSDDSPGGGPSSRTPLDVPPGRSVAMIRVMIPVVQD